MEIDSAQAEAMLADPDVQLVDVREPYEFEAGRIAGSRRIGLGDLTQAAQTLDQDRPLLFVCRSGSRSRMATQAFRQAGYDAYNLAGGLLDWEATGRPLEPDGGEVAR